MWAYWFGEAVSRCSEWRKKSWIQHYHHLGNEVEIWAGKVQVRWTMGDFWYYILHQKNSYYNVSFLRGF